MIVNDVNMFKYDPALKIQYNTDKDMHIGKCLPMGQDTGEFILFSFELKKERYYDWIF
ncbi:hypothetical protein D1872_176920 [compost metagenome]